MCFAERPSNCDAERAPCVVGFLPRRPGEHRGRRLKKTFRAARPANIAHGANGETRSVLAIFLYASPVARLTPSGRSLVTGSVLGTKVRGLTLSKGRDCGSDVRRIDSCIPRRQLGGTAGGKLNVTVFSRAEEWRVTSTPQINPDSIIVRNEAPKAQGYRISSALETRCELLIRPAGINIDRCFYRLQNYL